jgi:hypothetical protein
MVSAIVSWVNARVGSKFGCTRSGLQLVVTFLLTQYPFHFLFSLIVTHRVAAAEEEDEQVKEMILKLGPKGDKHEKKLLPLAELRKFMLVKPFSWQTLVERVEKNLRAWTKDTMEERPLLNLVYCGGLEEQRQVAATSPNPAAAAAGNAVGRLTRARTTLHAQGDDPLQESMDLANQAMGTQPPDASPKISSSRKQRRAKASFYDKHEAATRLSFGDSQPIDDIIDGEDDDDDEDNEQGAAHLSTLPSPVRSASGSRRKRKSRASPGKKTQQKKYEGRRRWTEEEKRAIKEGIRELGVGKWADIKAMYSVLLDERTSGQIKVRRLHDYVAIVDSLSLALQGHVHAPTGISLQIQSLTLHCMLVIVAYYIGLLSNHDEKGRILGGK